MRAPSVGAALTGAPELVELWPAPVRQELFRDVARASQAEAGRKAGPGVLFPVANGEELFAGAGLDLRADLFQSWDAGAGADLELASGAEGWSEEPRDSLQGLSEREAAALVGASLLQRWGVQAAGRVRVDRALGAPYAAAYVNGVLRINPSFVYLAAAGASLTPSP